MVEAVLEADLGLGPYVSPTAGLGGRLKARIEDFRVDEVATPPTRDAAGRYTAARVQLTNWETNAFLRAASDRLGISRKKIHFSGTKDKRGVTERWFTFEAPVEEVENLAFVPGVVVAEAYRTSAELELGEHRGNGFQIILRDVAVAPAEADAVVASTWKALQGVGVPNYFGPQRFGARRATTHVVGERMARGDFLGAVLTYLGEPLALNASELSTWRTALERRDWKAALAMVPEAADAERALLHRMVETNDPIDALRVFPTTLQRLFVHALQSWLFNHSLSKRLAAGLGLREPHVGDLAAPVEDGRMVELYAPVTASNRDRVRREVARGRAVLTGPIPGTEAVFAAGVVGEIERSVLAEAKLATRDFLIPEHLEWSSKGTRRPLTMDVTGLRWVSGPDAFYPGRTQVTFDFGLSAGCYATVLLREFMKSPRAQDYA